MSTPPSPAPRQGPSGGRGTVHGDLSQMAAPARMSGLLYYGVLLVAAGIDIATFYQVLALVMRNVPDEVVWLGVVGFTVTALALAHTMGVRVRDRVDNGQRALGSASAWLLFVVWLFVGLTAFVVRLTAAPPQVGGGTTIIEDGQPLSFGSPAEDPLLAALLFLALYVATGTVAAVAGYLRHNTAAKQYAATMRTRSDVAKDVAASAADLALARQTLVALQEERRRREEGWVKAQEEWHAIARRLKQEARLRLASAAQNPSVTDAYFDPPPALRRPAAAGSPDGAPVPAGAHHDGGPQSHSSSESSGDPASYGAQSGAPQPPQPYGGPASYGGPAYGGPPYGGAPYSGAPYSAAQSAGGPQPYPAPTQIHPGQAAVPAVAEQPSPWRLNPPGSHRPQVDHGGPDRREVGR